MNEQRKHGLTTIAPGIYKDTINGAVHYDAEEICVSRGLEPTQSNIQMTEQIIREMAAEDHLPVIDVYD